MNFDVDFSLNNNNFKANFGKVIAVGGDTEAAYNEGYEAGQKAEYDRFWDNYQNYGNSKSYRGAFSGQGWTAETFKPKYTPIRLVGGGGVRMFWEFSGKRTEERTSIDDSIVDFSECTDMTYAFADSTFDTVILNCSNAKTMVSTFNMGNGTSYGIREIYIKVTDLCTSFSSAFDYNFNLEKIMFTEDSVIGANISFAKSNKLTHESLMSIINALKDYSGTGTTRTLTLHATSKANLTDTEKAIATQKGWTIA